MYKFKFANFPFERGEILFSKGFFDFSDIRKGGPGLTMNNSLAEVHPELVSEWSEENLPLTPDDITFGSNEKVWWKGFIPDSKNGSLFA